MGKPYDRSKQKDDDGVPYAETGNYPMDHGKIRKLSVTISLNDPSEYDGGNLQFDFRNQTDWERNRKKIKSCTEIRLKGSIIVFPSFVAQSRTCNKIHKIFTSNLEPRIPF